MGLQVKSFAKNITHLTGSLKDTKKEIGEVNNLFSIFSSSLEKAFSTVGWDFALFEFKNSLYPRTISNSS